MTRSGLPADWIASHALAAVDLDAYDRDGAVRLLARYEDAGRAGAGFTDDAALLAEASVAAYVDLAAALVELCAAPEEVPGFKITFEDLDSATEVNPETFLDTIPGQAAVWATRTAVAATTGDTDTATALLSVLEGLEHYPAALHVSRLITATGTIMQWRYWRDEGSSAFVATLGGLAATYRAECADGCGFTYTGQVWRNRDSLAAQHTTALGHAVKRWME